MESPRRLDPLAVAVLSVAGIAAVGAAVWLMVSISRAPDIPDKRGAVERVTQTVDRLIRRFKATPPPAPAPPAERARAPTAAPAAKAPGSGPSGIDLPPGRTWTYAVRLEPEAWRDAVLVYRSRLDGGSKVVLAEFRHAQGNMAFHLGTYAAGHPSHAQVRFPGFFMHGAYFDFPLTQGKRFSWEYPWQLADNSLRAGRVRRFDAVVAGTEKLKVPAGEFDAVRIQATLNYVDGGAAKATVNESIWYAPSIGQIVKVERNGRSPDEAGQRIIAELAEVR